MGKCMLCGGETSFWTNRGRCKNCGFENYFSKINKKRGFFEIRFKGNVSLEYPVNSKYNSMEDFVNKNKERILSDRKIKEVEMKKEYVEEYKRTCNECGKVWHSLVSREKQIGKDVRFNAFIQAATAFGGNLGAATQSKRSVESQQDLLDKLRKCPNCSSTNYTEEIIKHEKSSQ